MKKKGIIISTIVLLVAILTTILIIGTNKSNNYYYDDRIISNKFEYEQTITDESIESDYYYSDSYFKDSSYLENEHLRTFALSIALSFNPTNRKEEVNYNLNKIYNELEFNDVEYYDLNDFSKDTIGTSMAHKKLNDKYELVIIVLRGASYQSEWESNLDLGNNGNAKGFDDSSVIVLNRLKDYINNNKIKDYKLLVTGYSRAAAISGLIGVHINEESKEYNIEKEDLYVYSFESPKYSNIDKKYKNIHNVINKNDIVTYVYPESWGLYHSGIDEDVTTNSKNIKERYLDIFSSEKIKELEEIDLQRFIKKFINSLPKDRTGYDDIYNSIIDIYRLINNKTTYERNIIINHFKTSKIDLNLDYSIKLLSLLNSNDKESLKKSYNSFISIFDKDYYKIKDLLSEKEYNSLKDDIFNILFYLKPMINDEYKSNYKFSNILTFAFNLEDIFKEHYFNTILKQVQNKDSYYNENAY